MGENTKKWEFSLMKRDVTSILYSATRLRDDVKQLEKMSEIEKVDLPGADAELTEEIRMNIYDTVDRMAYKLKYFKEDWLED